MNKKGSVMSKSQEGQKDWKAQLAERLGEYLQKTRGKNSKTDMAKDLGITYATYLGYETADAGPKGVTLEFLQKIAHRDNRSISSLLAELEAEKLPEASRSSGTHEDWAKLFREESPEAIQKAMEALAAQFPRSCRYARSQGGWALNIIEKLARLPRENLLHMEDQVYRYLILVQAMTEEEGKERLHEILAEKFTVALASRKASND
jgi:transcriptional regulator with XRE-family HTH domain